MVLRRSIRMVVPRFLTGPLSRGAGCYSPERTSGPKLKTTLAWTSASSAGGPGPVHNARPVPPSHHFSYFALQSVRISRFVSRPFWPVFGVPKVPEFRANKPGTRCLDRPTEWSFWNPLGSDRRDPNTLPPNRIKARTTPLRPSRISTSS